MTQAEEPEPQVDLDRLQEQEQNFSSLVAYLTEKRKGLKEFRQTFEFNVGATEQKIQDHGKAIRDKADEMVKIMMGNLQERAATRKAILDRDAEVLNDLQVKLLQLNRKSSPGRTRLQGKLNEANHKRQLEELRREADNCFDGSDAAYAAITQVNVAESTFYRQFLQKDPEDFFSIQFSMNASQVG